MTRACLLAVTLIVPMQIQSDVQIDHLILGISDLDRGMAEFEAKTGVRPVFGGAHPGRGTHNALASLGNGTYVEILAPNPAAPAPDESRIIQGLDALESLQPVGWALTARDLADVRQRAEAGGVATTQVTPGSRMLPDGSKLEWMTAGVTSPVHDWAPFFIQWRNPALQPSNTTPTGCTLSSVAITDPDPSALRTLFASVGFEVPLTEGAVSKMTIVLTCPNGAVTF